MGSHRMALFAADYVGFHSCERLLAAGCQPAVLVVVDDEGAPFRSEIHRLFEGRDIPVFRFAELKTEEGLARFHACKVDIALLLWWPYIVKEALVNSVQTGFLNTHPSLLPHNRGKHYNFWNLVEDVPFGVSLHWVTPGIDDGPVAFQQRLEKTWEDTGESLFLRARAAMVELVVSNYDAIRRGAIPALPQSLEEGSFHLARELDPASEVKLDRNYSARALLNLLRARTFPPHPGAWFVDGGKKFEVRVEIRRVPTNDGDQCHG